MIRYNLMSLSSPRQAGGSVKAEVVHRNIFRALFAEDRVDDIEYEVDSHGVVQAFTMNRIVALFVYTKRARITNMLYRAKRMRQINGFVHHNDVKYNGIVRK